MRYLLLIFAVFFFAGCNQTVEIKEDQPPAGTYNYKGFDSTGVLIVEGSITIQYSDSVTIKGSWNLNAVGTPGNIGPQIGQGELIGGYDNEVTWIQLNPNFVDNNVGLSGIYKGSLFKGEWFYSSFIGPTNKGDFSAELN